MATKHPYITLQRLAGCKFSVVIYGENKSEMFYMPAPWNAYDVPKLAQVRAWLADGMASLAPRLTRAERQEADALTVTHTCFDSLADMANALGGYRPSLHTSERNDQGDRLPLLRLADLYDKAQAQRGDPRRAYRY